MYISECDIQIVVWKRYDREHNQIEYAHRNIIIRPNYNCAWIKENVRSATDKKKLQFLRQYTDRLSTELFDSLHDVSKSMRFPYAQRATKICMSLLFSLDQPMWMNDSMWRHKKHVLFSFNHGIPKTEHFHAYGRKKYTHSNGLTIHKIVVTWTSCFRDFR